MEQVQSEADAYPDRFGRASIVLFALGLMLMTALICAWRVKVDHDVTLQATRKELSLFATALGRQVETMVRDSVGVASAGAQSMPPGSTPEQKQQVLQRLLNGDDYMRALFVLKDDTVVIANREGESFGTDGLPAPAELQRAAHGVWFGKVIEEDDGALILPVARRVPIMRRAYRKGDVWAGSFLRIGELDSVFGHLKELHSNVALVTHKGVGLLQLPLIETNMRNVDISGSEIFRMYLHEPVQRLTLLEGPDVATGEPRLYAAYRMAGLPTFAAAGRMISDALRQWRQRTALLLAFLALWTTVAMALAVRLQILWNRRWKYLQELAAANRKAAEAVHAELVARRGMTRELLVAQERDRQRLAAELHDSVGQHLSMLRNQAVQLKRAATTGETREHAESLIDLASETIEEVRAVAHNLRPVHLEELGLSSALAVMLERIELSSGLIVHSRIENVDDLLHGESAVHAYRIVQEATSNVLRHADASTLWIDVIREDQAVQLSIRDDGRGMETGSAMEAPGLGMTSIGERCAILGAALTIRPNEPRGTSIEIHIPRRDT